MSSHVHLPPRTSQLEAIDTFTRLPYVAQGAAQAIEDVGALSVALNQFSGLEELPLSILLKTYELARKSRAENVADTGGATRSVLHLFDGAEQRARDEKFRAVAQGGENPDLLYGN